MKLAAALLLNLAIATPALTAQSDEIRCEECPFTLQIPQTLTVEIQKRALHAKGDGIVLDAAVETGDFERRVERLSNPIPWWRELRPSSLEFQSRTPERGVYRGVEYASMAGTAVRGRRPRLWLAWMAFNTPGGTVTTLIYKIEGNPSEPHLLDLYDEITASLRWDDAPKVPTPPEPSDRSDKATTPRPRSPSE